MRRLVAGAFSLFLLLGVSSAGALITQGGCVQTVFGGNTTCTANDVTFAVVGLGVQDDGCVSTSDTVSILLRAQVGNRTAQTRYDVGMYVNTQGGSAETDTGATNCARDRLTPVGTQGVEACPSLDLDSGVGPYLNVDGDACGDLFNEDHTGCDQNASGNPWDDSIFDFPSSLAFPCRDVGSTGFVNIPTCATWGNQAKEVPNNGQNCASDSDVRPGTPSKCNCSDLETTIPAPSLSLACTCSPATVRQGASTACTVTFTNGVDCAPNTGTDERFRCGTASFVRFKADYDQTKGSVFTTSETTSGSISHDTGNGLITWTPRNQIAGGSLGVIGDNQSGSLTFQYFVDPATANGAANVSVATFWSNVSGFSPEVSQSALQATCAITVSDSATWASVAGVSARRASDGVVVEWQTAAEVGTLGFELLRRDEASGEYVSASRRLLPAVGQAPGGRYRFVDPDAPAAEQLTYKVVEIEAGGRRREHGPFRLPVGARPAGDVEAEADFFASAHAPALRALKAAPTTTPAPPSGAPVSRAKLGVKATGVYRLTAADIQSALRLPNLTTAERLIERRQVRLTRGGEEVAWHLAPGGKAIVFYGEGLDSLFATDNVYWLENARGLEMETVAARAAAPPAAGSFAELRHVEQDRFPSTFAVTDPLEDYWFWKSFVGGDPGIGRATFAVDVPGPERGGQTATLTANLLGFTGDQALDFMVNGHPAGSAAWDGTGRASVEVELAESLLNDGANTLEVVATRGIFFLDSFDLAYARRLTALGGELRFAAPSASPLAVDGFSEPAVWVYEVSAPRAPRRLEVTVEPTAAGYRAAFAPRAAGTPYVAVAQGAWRSVAWVEPVAQEAVRSDLAGAPYLVVTSEALLPAARRLADYRAGRGLAARVITVEQIWDDFSFGVPDPAALRDFLVWATANWNQPPRYVALAGRGTYDYKNLLGLGGNHVPPLMTAAAGGLLPADNRLADFDGDGKPELAIGRIPALTASELDVYVDKVMAYEAASGDWTRRVTLVADDPDRAGDFPRSADRLAAVLRGGLTTDALYLPGLPGDLAVLRGSLVERWLAGRLLVAYVGHGGLDRLTSEGLLLTSDVGALAGAPRLPVVAALTCNAALHAYPGLPSLGEELVVSPGGAIAVFGPTGLSNNEAATELGVRLLAETFGASGMVLGDGVLRALRSGVEGGELVPVYALLGDPALILK